MIPFVVNEIRRLSQEEGLFDDEIAEYLGVSRATVNRTRNLHGIPKANLSMRKDKSYMCRGCEEVIMIRRFERRRTYCPDCLQK